MFYFIRNCKIIFQSNSIILHSHHQYMRVSVAPNLTKILYCLLNRSVTLIYISPISNDVQYLFTCVIGHLNIFFYKIFKFSAHFKKLSCMRLLIDLYEHFIYSEYILYQIYSLGIFSLFTFLKGLLMSRSFKF